MSVTVVPPAVRAVRGWHRPLVVHSTLMAALVVVSVVGLLVDPRTLAGESVWVKPLKFGLSLCGYGFTLAWLLSQLVRGRRVGWWFGSAFAVSGIVDVAAVVLAAANGTFSHFNMSDDLLNTVVQNAFRLFVPVLFLANVAIGLVVLLQRGGERGVRTALATGLPIASAGMLVAILLIAPSAGSWHTLPDSHDQPVTLSSSHSVGPDTSGGAGMPITGWNTAGGDMRVPHFVGLHGIHVLLLLALVLSASAARHRWLRDDRVRARLVGTAAAAHAGVFAVTTWQAARGQSVIAPDLGTLVTLFTVVAIAGAVAVGIVHRAREVTGQR